MVPWLPVEMLSEDKACFDSSNVLTTLEPKKDMSEYYQDLVTQSLERQDGKEEFFEDEWEEITDEYINTTPKKKGNMLH
tara:strand:- start:865 stop:1101 length:237 start_codon:yes stop_codon:yes gene_type:complete